jgi:hypothetical protein
LAASEKEGLNREPIRVRQCKPCGNVFKRQFQQQARRPVRLPNSGEELTERMRMNATDMPARLPSILSF